MAAELVERVVLLGAPISIKDENWEAARKVVIGNFSPFPITAPSDTFIHLTFIYFVVSNLSLSPPFICRWWLEDLLMLTLQMIGCLGLLSALGMHND